MTGVQTCALPISALALWEDIGASVARTGLRKLIVFNSHGGQPQLVDVLCTRLRAAHGLFAVAATGRSAVQLGLEPGKAPLAYSLSLVAAVLYLVATTCLLLGGSTGWRVAGIAVTVELLGVLSVGTLSYVATGPDRKPRVIPEAATPPQ